MTWADLLLVGLLCFSVMAHTEEVITNDTGEDAICLRVVFSNPVLITGFENTLASVEPETGSSDLTAGNFSSSFSCKESCD